MERAALRPAAERGPARSLTGRLPGWPLAALLALPSVLWVAKDDSVWSFDPSEYALWSVDLWRALTAHPAAWWGTMMHVIPHKSPGLSWVGQLFVPLGAMAGSVERGLMIPVLAAYLAALVLCARTAAGVRPDLPAAPAVAALGLGAAPLAVAMSHHYMTEVPQLACVAYAFFVAARAWAWPALRTGLHLALALGLGLAVKVSTLSYVLAPAALAALRAGVAWRRGRGREGMGRADLALAAAAVLVAALDAAWYTRNLGHVLAFARMAVVGAFHYGHAGTVPEKLAYWTRALAASYVILPAVVVAAAVAALAVARWTRGGREGATPADRALVAAAALQVVLVFSVLARSVNEETRFLLALGPALAVLLVAALPGRRLAPVAAVVAALLAVQWCRVELHALGWRELSGRGWWERPAGSDGKVGEVERLVAATCPPGGAPGRVLAGVDLAWVNPFTLEFYAGKRSLVTGRRCRYEGMGPDPRTLEAVWPALDGGQVEQLISMDPGALPDPPDFLNVIARPLLARVSADPRFTRAPFDSPSGLRIYRRSPAP